MSDLKPKPTPLKFKGHKPLTQPKRRFYSDLVAEDNDKKQPTQTSDKKLPEETDSPKLKGSPTKKVKVDSSQTNVLLAVKSDKTAAEMSYDLIKRKRIMERIDDKMRLSHREKLDKYNRSLNKLPEHYDIHKIGEKIQKGY